MLKQFTNEDKQLSEKKKVQIKEKRRPKLWDHSSPWIDQQDILIRVDDPSISSKNWISTIKKMQLKGIENASNCGISDASNMNRVQNKDDSDSPSSTKKPIIGISWSQFQDQKLLQSTIDHEPQIPITFLANFNDSSVSTSKSVETIKIHTSSKSGWGSRDSQIKNH